MDASLAESVPTGLGTASPTQEVRSTPCEVVVWNRIIRRRDETPRAMPSMYYKSEPPIRPLNVFPGRRMQVSPRLCDHEPGRISLHLDG